MFGPLRRSSQASGVEVIHSPFTHTVRLLPGQPVRKEDLVQDAVRCLNEFRSGGMPQQGVCGVDASKRAICARNSPPLMTERCSMLF